MLVSGDGGREDDAETNYKQNSSRRFYFLAWWWINKLYGQHTTWRRPFVQQLWATSKHFLRPPPKKNTQNLSIVSHALLTFELLAKSLIRFIKHRKTGRGCFSCDIVTKYQEPKLNIICRHIATCARKLHEFIIWDKFPPFNAAISHFGHGTSLLQVVKMYFLKGN